jgi:hypothetical protein
MMPPELRNPFERFNTLGAMLPKDLDFLADDEAALADARLILSEMRKVDAETNRYLDRYRQRQ